MCDTQKTNRDSKHGVKIFLNNLFYNWWALRIAAVVWFAAMRADSREVADSGVEFFQVMFCIECLINEFMTKRTYTESVMHSDYLDRSNWAS